MMETVYSQYTTLQWRARTYLNWYSPVFDTRECFTQFISSKNRVIIISSSKKSPRFICRFICDTKQVIPVNKK